MKSYFVKLTDLAKKFIILLSIAGCHNYYMASPINKNYDAAKAIDSLKLQDKYFILRSGFFAYHMKDISISDDNKTLKTTLEALPADQMMYIAKDRNRKMIYKKHNPDDLKVFNEAHVYVASDTGIKVGDYILQLNDIKKMEVITRDKAKSTTSYIIGGIAIIAATALLVVSVAALVTPAPEPVYTPPPGQYTGSCPYISTYTGNKFQEQGEIYSGAIYPQLARNDYMPLLMSSDENGKLVVRISNRLKDETEHTDMASLIVVNHSTNTKVLPDENGNLYSISNPQSPYEAWSPNKGSVLSLVAKEGDNAMLRFDDTLTSNAGNYVVTKFKNPENKKKAALVLSIKNTWWLEYVHSQIVEQFGSYYPSFVKKQYKKSASKLIEWSKNQQIPLQVSIKTKTGWQTVANLNSTGLATTREVVVPLDLSNIADNSVQIKLSSGFMFWDIDYAAIDFSNDKNFEIETVSPAVATDETGKNVLQEISKKDAHYLEQPLPGNVTTLEYKCKPQQVNTSRSYILHTYGYYTHSWNFNNSPNIAFLKQLKRPNAFPFFSISLYKAFMNSGNKTFAKN